MLIVGAKGFAKEVLEVVSQNDLLEGLAFFDDVSDDIPTLLYDRFPILRNEDQVRAHFQTFGNDFTIGVGNPQIRGLLYKRFKELGGNFTTMISNSATIGHFGTEISAGCNIMQKVVITNDVNIGKGVLVNQFCSVGHDVIIHDFVEICPSVSISGNCSIGEYSFIGTGVIILPNINIGKNVIVGAGAVVNKDLPDNCVAMGIPAKIIKNNND